MCGGGKAPVTDYGAQKAAADAETARIEAQRKADQDKADQQVLSDKVARAAKEADAAKARKSLLAKAAEGDGINDSEDALNPTTRKRNASLLGG
ncbi:hypothetical protein Q9Q94_10275 [Uliginosibacterium sp. 31-16]|uniref:hypothetical protein n=1 Tax=Uliginosibacterium sp. 31-16 TaxID=3068315 RepID=UPI00273E2418|nr:hypothetical protein [Uliginosibacterium sp. 31-16]MDP5239921.1 hypothetical protein [Uliginosibacterium sp. 31-16]